MAPAKFESGKALPKSSGMATMFPCFEETRNSPEIETGDEFHED
jgi:hypothetical protein